MKNQSSALPVFFQTHRDTVFTFIREHVHSDYIYHDIRHTQDVMAQADLIAQHMGVDEYSTLLLRTAALYHDTGFSVRRHGHEEEGVIIFRHDAEKFGLTSDEIDQISALIRATKLPQRPADLLEQIICDADLDYLGRTDFPEISALLYLELKSSGEIESRQEWYKLQCAFLDRHTFHTEYSKSRNADGLAENRRYALSLLSS